MSETAQHLKLTRAIIDFIQARFPLDSFSLFNDLPGSSNKPPRIYGFVPDVFAENVPRTIVIIGEAKTTQDLTTEHSKAQIAEFVRYLAAQTNALFVLAVPWPVAVLARHMVEEYLHRFDARNVEAVILDGVQARAATGPHD